jgi:hypothetical protein
MTTHCDFFTYTKRTGLHIEVICKKTGGKGPYTRFETGGGNMSTEIIGTKEGNKSTMCMGSLELKEHGSRDRLNSRMALDRPHTWIYFNRFRVQR